MKLVTLTVCFVFCYYHAAGLSCSTPFATSMGNKCLAFMDAELDYCDAHVSEIFLFMKNHEKSEYWY